jgi:hypothetical protein
LYFNNTKVQDAKNSPKTNHSKFRVESVVHTYTPNNSRLPPDGFYGESNSKINIVTMNKIEQEPHPTPKTKAIDIHVESKNITLPTNTATLEATFVNNTLENLNLNVGDLEYNWTLVDIVGSTASKDNVVMKDADKQQLIVSELEKGTYKFQIVVTGHKDLKIKATGTIIVISGNLIVFETKPIYCEYILQIFM